MGVGGVQEGESDGESVKRRQRQLTALAPADPHDPYKVQSDLALPLVTRCRSRSTDWVPGVAVRSRSLVLIALDARWSTSPVREEAMSDSGCSSIPIACGCSGAAPLAFGSAVPSSTNHDFRPFRRLVRVRCQSCVWKVESKGSRNAQVVRQEAAERAGSARCSCAPSRRGTERVVFTHFCSINR